MPSFEGYKDLDFRIIDEPWNVYLLDDYTTIKQRLILTKMMYKEIEKGKLDFRFGHQILTTAANVQEHGEPSPQLPIQELRNHIIEDNIRFEVRYQEWNDYEFEPKKSEYFRLRILNSLAMAHKTNKYNNDGEIIYLTDSSQQIIIIPPKPKSREDY